MTNGYPHVRGRKHSGLKCFFVAPSYTRTRTLAGVAACVWLAFLLAWFGAGAVIDDSGRPATPGAAFPNPPTPPPGLDHGCTHGAGR